MYTCTSLLSVERFHDMAMTICLHFNDDHGWTAAVSIAWNRLVRATGFLAFLALAKTKTG